MRNMSENKIIIVGGGLAGLMATIRAAESGFTVDLFSLVPVKRSHSACAQGGINGALNTKGENDSTAQHFLDTVKGGDFLANQPPAKALAEAAPGILRMYDRMGVTFNRTREGFMDLRLFGGVLHRRTAFAGSTTGQQLLYALDEQVRRHEAAGKVKKYEGWDFQGLVLENEGKPEARCRGIVAMCMNTMKMDVFAADGVIMATGGLGVIFGKSTNSLISTGAAAGQCYAQGALFANGEFIQIHPTAIPGDDKNRLMSESARGEGGRIWTWGQTGKTIPHPDNPTELIPCGETGKPWFFLEEMYPKYGNLVPRDIATRAIFKLCVEQGMGIEGKNQVYLDLTHIDPHELERRLGGILDIYHKFMGEDPKRNPMRIFPSPHFSMGGLYVRYETNENGEMRQDSTVTHMTSIDGLYAAGECEYQYHGANRLGANSLLSATFAGGVAATAALLRIQAMKPVERVDRLDPAILENARRRFEDRISEIEGRNGKENAFELHHELGELMNENVTVIRVNANLEATEKKLLELKGRLKGVKISDHSKVRNAEVLFTKNLDNMFELAMVITRSALLRNESRGAHYKPEFPERQDEWTRTTLARYTPAGPEITYEPVDMRFLQPVKRNYR